VDAHPQRTFVFHFLPVARVLVEFYEVWFSILSRKCLRRADLRRCQHRHPGDRRLSCSPTTRIWLHPFEWKKGVRFYKRLKDKIAARSELQLAA